MRAKLQNLQQLHSGRSFICYELKIPRFEFFWHFHPEYELTYIIKGRGRRLVGDSVENFREGDLVLIGPQVPHSWVSDAKRKEQCQAIVLQFPISFVDTLFRMPELEGMGSLFRQSSNGLQLRGAQLSIVLKQLRLLSQCKSTQAISGFLGVLDAISSLKARPLASVSYHPSSIQQTTRISKVLAYIQQHFTTEISLSRTASVIHLSESAFCKYFKRTMGKTFSDYVNEVRITHAMMLLLETDKSIQSVAYQSGFENISYFNRVFLRKNRITPGKFRLGVRE